MRAFSPRHSQLAAKVAAKTRRDERQGLIFGGKQRSSTTDGHLDGEHLSGSGCGHGAVEVAVEMSGLTAALGAAPMSEPPTASEPPPASEPPVAAQ